MLTVPSKETHLYIKDIQIFDLTQMFGEGNEPTTIEEFKALYPNEYYDYVESRYEYTPGYYENGQVVEHIPDTAFITPFPEMPEEVRCVSDAKVDVSSKGIIWNQLCKVYTAKESCGLVATKINDYSVSIKGTQTNSFTSSSSSPVSFRIEHIKIGHKYIVLPNIQGNEYISSFRCLVGFSNNIGDATIITGIANNYGTIYLYSTSTKDNVWDCVISIIVSDLTEMFGEGNEPETVEEFKRLFPKDYYPYDPGTLRTIKGLHPIILTSTEIPFELYGADGVNDEVEPCVLVDGEWKCRVTRRWRKVILDGTHNMMTDAIATQLRKQCPYAYFRTDSQMTPVASSKWYSNQFKYTTRTNDVTNGVFECVWSTSVLVFNINKNRLNITDSDTIDTYLAKFKAYFKARYDSGNPVIIYYRPLNPTIELYPPIPIRTLPINTIINSDAELDCNIKVIDKDI